MALPLALAAISVGTSVYSAIQQDEAARAQRRSLQLQQRIADIKAARERVKLARESRVAREQTRQASATGGTTGSTGALSAAGAVSTQFAAGTSFLNQVQSLAGQASIFEQRAVSATGRAAVAGAVSSLAQFGFTNAPQLQSIFSRNTNAGT